LVAHLVEPLGDFGDDFGVIQTPRLGQRIEKRLELFDVLVSQLVLSPFTDWALGESQPRFESHIATAESRFPSIVGHDILIILFVDFVADEFSPARMRLLFVVFAPSASLESFLADGIRYVKIEHCV